jgi:hypothetical protein
MFEAQYLFSTDTVYSPWMSRGGDNLIATVDVAGLDGTGAGVLVQLYEKNTEDNGDGTLNTSGTITKTDAGRKSQEFLGVKELVRFRFSNPGSKGDRVLFRMLQTVWFDTVDGTI